MTATQWSRTRSCAFGPLEIRYDGRVLTPRPWTLLQSRWAAEVADSAADGPILELCAGAGQIGLAAAALSGRPLVQVEADATAVEFARLNATQAGLPVDVRHAGIDAALAPDELFPIVLADPPYLPSSHLERWPEDPATAIDGGRDGLDVVRTCLRVAADHLQPQGVLLLQVAGEAQAEAVRGLVGDHAGPTWRETRHHDAERAVMLFVAGAPDGR